MLVSNFQLLASEEFFTIFPPIFRYGQPDITKQDQDLCPFLTTKLFMSMMFHNSDLMFSSEMTFYSDPAEEKVAYLMIFDDN